MLLSPWETTFILSSFSYLFPSSSLCGINDQLSTLLRLSGFSLWAQIYQWSFLYFWRLGSLRLKCHLIWFLGEGSLCSLQSGTFSLCSQIEQELWSLPFLIRTLIPPWNSTVMTSSQLNYFTNSPPNTIKLKVRVSTYKFRGRTQTLSS
jgi:hypothetical protein